MTYSCLIFLIYLYFLTTMSELPSALSLTYPRMIHSVVAGRGEKTIRKSQGTVQMSKDERPTKAIKVHLTGKPIVFEICIFASFWGPELSCICHNTCSLWCFSLVLLQHPTSEE